MKYYIIFYKDIFVGYTTSYEMLKLFLKSRKPKKYMVKIVKEKDIDEEILNSNILSEYELSLYQGYSVDIKLPIFDYEREMLDESIYRFLSDINSDLVCLLNKIKYIKFNSDEDKQEVISFLNYLLDDVLCGSEEFETNFDEIIDIEKYFKKYILNGSHKLKQNKSLTYL